MSLSARNWAWDTTSIGEGPMKVGQKAVLLCLAEHENVEAGYSYPSHDRIAERTCLSIRAVYSHLESLKASGLIRVEKRRARGGIHLRNVYFLAVDDSYRDNDPQWQRHQV